MPYYSLALVPEFKSGVWKLSGCLKDEDIPVPNNNQSGTSFIAVSFS